MAVVFMPKKAALVWMSILGIICIIGYAPRGELKPVLAGTACLIYVIATLIIDSRKKKKRVSKPD